MSFDEARDLFDDRPDFWKGGEFKPEIDFALNELTVGLIIAKFALKGIAGIYQFYGPFIPERGPLGVKFFQRAEAELQLYAEGVGVRYFLEYTPEAESYFLAFDFSNRTLISDDEIRRVAQTIAHQLMSRWQQIERDGMRARNEAAGRQHPSQRRPQVR